MVNDVTAYLRAQDSGFTSTLSKASSMMGKFAGSSEKSGKTFLESAKSVMVGVGMYKAARTALSAVTNSISSAMARQDTMDTFDRNLTRITGSAETATKTLDELKAATRGTAYGLGAVANSTMSFANSNIALEKSVQYSKDWMDAVAAYGDGTTETYERVTLQLNQMASKGKANLGDLKSAMEAGIPVIQIMAQQTGKSTQEISDSLSKGELSAEEFMDAMHEAFTNGAGSFKAIAGEAKNAGNTWKGTIDNMKSAITRGTLSMINSFDDVTKTLTGSSIKEWLTTTGALFENNLGKVGTALQAVVNFILPYKNAMQEAFVGVGGEVKEAILSVVQSLQGMYSTFDGTSSVNTFKDIMVVIAEKIRQASIWIQQNSDEIAKWVVWIGKAALAFKGLQIATGIFQPMVASAAKASEAIGKFSSALVIANGKASLMATGLTTGLMSAFRTAQTGVGVFALNFQSAFNSIGGSMGANKFTTPFLALNSAISSTFPKIGAFNTKIGSMGKSILHPIQSLQTLKVSLAATSVAAGGSGKAVNGALIKVGGGFKAMATGGIGAIKSLSAAMLTNPITAVLLLITAAVVAFAVAWRNNFENIQGVMKKFGSGLLNSITSMKSLFNGLGTALKPLLSAFGALGKVIGGLALGALMYVVAGLVDGFRFLVTSVMAVVRGLIMLGLAAKMAVKAISGDWEGAADEMDKIKDQIGEIQNGFTDLGKNSAIKSTTKSLGEFGKETDEAKTKVNEMRGKVTEDFNKVSQAAQDMSTKFEESKTKMDEVFNYEGQNESNLKYFETAKMSMDNFIKGQEDTNTKYQEAMEAISEIDEKNVDRRAALIAQANSDKMASVSANNAGLIALEKDYSKMLAENQDASGEALTEQQRSYLQEQTAMIKEQLILQNEAYVQAAQDKLNQGVALSETEKTATLSTLGSLYEQKKEAIATNEEQIAQQKEIVQNAQSEAERANAEQEIANLTTKNSQLIADQSGYGQNMLAILTDQGVVNAETVGIGLQKMGDISNEKLAEILRAFQLNNGSISETLTVLTGVMQTKGVEGASSLKQAFETGDFTGLMSNVSQGMIEGISTLPPEMFNKGNDGKQQFINALQSGQTDSKALGAMLSGEVTKGVDSGKTGLSGSAKAFADVFPTSLEAKKSDINKIVKDTADYLPKEIKKKENDTKNAAKDNGNAVASGIESTNANVTTKSKDLMNGSVSAMKTVDFKPVGSYITAGVADGMDGTAAINKAQTIVDQVKNKMKEAADIHSPSRLFRDEIGKNISLGLAVGIEEYGREAVNTAQNLMDTLYSVSTSTGFGGIIPDNGKLEVTTSDSFISRLEQTFEKFIENHQYIVMDNGALIGETAHGYNVALGGIIGKEKRDRW
ncbi:tape measure protein [Carnobacterium maltaromaticum]|uniref:tape measure protein n=1 Tax=Carnobacterium maltaromaticum TaxID=2751 RepID=UPI0039B04D77